MKMHDSARDKQLRHRGGITTSTTLLVRLSSSSRRRLSTILDHPLLETADLLRRYPTPQHPNTPTLSGSCSKTTTHRFNVDKPTEPLVKLSQQAILQAQLPAAKCHAWRKDKNSRLVSDYSHIPG
jgi:hypothetical protein